MEAFTQTKTKAELFRAALDRGLLIAPVTTMAEVVESPQLAARDYWQRLEHPELGQAFRYPGAFAQFSATPITYRRRPPTVGEHNREIYIDELGFTGAAFGRSPEQRRRVMAHDMPLADVKILDFTWVMAGPAATCPRRLRGHGGAHRIDASP